MNYKQLQQITRFLAIGALATTMVLGVYMAQPWGDNYTYRNIIGYVALLLILGWACTPYLYLATTSSQVQAPQPAIISRLVALLVASVGGLTLLVNATFIHLDPQNGLVLLFLPIYQWLVIGLFEIIGYAIPR